MADNISTLGFLTQVGKSGEMKMSFLVKKISGNFQFWCWKLGKSGKLKIAKKYEGLIYQEGKFLKNKKTCYVHIKSSWTLLNSPLWLSFSCSNHMTYDRQSKIYIFIIFTHTFVCTLSFGDISTVKWHQEYQMSIRASQGISYWRMVCTLVCNYNIVRV